MLLSATNCIVGAKYQEADVESPSRCSGANHEMVPRGLEPRTLRLLAVRSNQLSYETIEKNEFLMWFSRANPSPVSDWSPLFSAAAVLALARSTR